MTAAFVGVVAFDLLIGIGIAVALSVADLFRRVARAHDAVQGSVPDLAGLHDIDDYPDAKTIPGLVVYRYDAPTLLRQRRGLPGTRACAPSRPSRRAVEWVVLNMEANVEIDLTATDMLDELRAELASRGIVLALARVKQDLALYLDRAGLLERIGDRPRVPDAADRARRIPDTTLPAVVGRVATRSARQRSRMSVRPSRAASAAGQVR